jgi:branched-chain amino acid aminotransferase
MSARDQFPFSEVRSIWMNGELLDFDEARTHPLSHGLHYGSGVFEGMRCYDGPAGPAVFRLDAHLRRFEASARTLRMDLGYDRQELAAAVLETLRANELREAYIRPLAYRGFGSMRMNPLPCPVEVLIATWPTRGRFLGDGSDVEGIDVGVSSWRRPSPESMPVGAKATANYINAQLATVEAAENGFGEAIVLDTKGDVSEGAAMNLFLVRDGALWTPPVSSSILEGITRGSILELARELDLPASERTIPRGMLYTCDELFLTGTSAEITPVRSVDRIPVGDGRPGPITRRLMERFEAIAHGEADDPYGWRTPVYPDS